MHRRATPVLVLMVLVCGSLLTGWAPAHARQGATPHVLRFYWGDGFQTMLEPQQTESGTVDVTFLNYEGLTRFDEELNVVPGAAESWQFNDDGTQITFRLRDNLTYSDGSPLLAERFRDAMVRQCDPHLNTFNVDNLSDVIGCAELHAVELNADGSPVDAAAYEAARANFGARAVDERTLEIDLRKPAPYFPALAALNVSFMPIKQELLDGWDPEQWLDPAVWVGNGPFQVVEIEPEGAPPHIRFVRNERYWGGMAKLDAVEYVVLPYDEAMQAYRDGYLTVMRPWEESMPAIEADPILSRDVLNIWIPFIEMFNFNFNKEPFTDQKVREAFAYGFDRDAWCLEMMYGGCTPHLSWIPSEVPGAIETDAFAFDPAKAREALAASSYGGPEGLPEIALYHQNDDPADFTQAEWIANQYRQVLGVEMTLAPVTPDELDALMDDVETWPQFAGTGWYSDMPDPHDWLEMWTCGSPFFSAEVGYCNPEYDEFFARVDSEMDPEERIRLAEEAQRLLLADAPAIFGFTFDSIQLVQPYVVGYSPTAPNQFWPGWWTPLTVDVEPPR
ncbi:MAG: putative transporter, substrate binding protein (oligopeptide) [Thermomicrobiales bacterium]|nr:putative transporter, substrate binding protein (oligopeptide) [Thermomicrobiales bacterium]